MGTNNQHYDVVVVGSGFGGTMVALSLARALKDTGKKILILERGTWWTTPVGTVQDKAVATYDFLKQKKQPVQFWPSMDHFKGFLDILLRCFRHEGNEDGLYDFTAFGRKGFLGIGAENDGIMILRASGVGGGSLVYSNITIQPPDIVFDDARWPGWTRDKKTRDGYYDLARQAIGFGVVYAREAQDNPTADPAGLKKQFAAYGGLHNIATRSARIDPHFEAADDPGTGRKVLRLSTSHPTTDPKNALWIDRARIFQSAAARLEADAYGNVDSAINDQPLGSDPFDPGEKPTNYCERQGRCNVGCLPGARYTLNKQLMKAVYGSFDNPTPQFPNLDLWPLVEVDHIETAGAGYAIKYRQRNADKPEDFEEGTVTADRVVVSAGCVGTTEILLRSQQNGLPGLSDRLGEGFSTNGDYLAFLENTDEIASLTRGPVTTSFAHFNQDSANKARFHTLEDQGIPKALASIIGYGVPFIQAICDGVGPRSARIIELLHLLEKRAVSEVGSFFKDAHERQPEFASEDEKVAKMMCVVGMGLDAAAGKFTLGEGGDTALRLKRTDGKEFHEDPIFDEIRKSLGRLAKVLSSKAGAAFVNPFLSATADALEAKAIVTTHPLGGCKMATGADQGTVDEFGRAFDKSGANGGVYPGLYVADASMVPTALGLNPSLTISALSLSVADKILAEINAK
jgi:choline dehydrogenase-like flavoprotein